MRSITIREFQRNFYQELNNLPFVVTRRANKVKGHPVSTTFVVIAYRPDLIISPEDSDIELKNQPTPEKKGFLGFFKK
jgi:hypothetical protein